MNPHLKNLNHIWLRGNEEEKEALRILFLDLAREMDHPGSAEIKPAQLDIPQLTEWLTWMSARWSGERESLVGLFLEETVEEINRRRERDITLI